MMGVNTRNMKNCLQKCNKLSKSHLVGQLLNHKHSVTADLNEAPEKKIHVGEKKK